MSLVRNGWYVAAFDSEIVDSPSSVSITGLPILLYRTSRGTVVALEDRCAHRHVPLSLGDRIDDDIRCRYHGFRYAPTGKCVDIPGQAVPKVMCVRAFPTVERYGFVWLWPGNSSLADPGLIPSYHLLETEGYVQDRLKLVIEAPILAIVENLLDLTHIPFAHSLLGVGNPVHEAEMRSEIKNDRVSCVRELARPDGSVMSYAGHYYLPGVVNASATPRDSNTGQQVPGFSSNSLHCLTPIDENRTRYFALKSWNKQTSAEEIEAMRELNRVTLDEDKAILEAMTRMKRSSDDLPPERLISADRAAVLARRAYKTMLARD